jgi:hypothetical protein
MGTDPMLFTYRNKERNLTCRSSQRQVIQRILGRTWTAKIVK